MLSHSFMSDSLQPLGLLPARLLPQDFPGKNTSMGCHFLLEETFLTQGLNLCLLYLLHQQVDFFYHLLTYLTYLLLGGKVMTNLDSMLKSRDITLPTKVHLVKAMLFPVVMYGYESWTVNKAECQKIDAFELWCWRRLLRVLWTARRSN